MQRPKLAVVALAALTLPLAAQRPDRDIEPPELQHGTFTTHSFESEALAGDAEYGVYLPKSYDQEGSQDRRYPLVIWLHGMFEDHERFHVRGGSKVLDEMIGDGAVPEMVFVTANGGRSFYINTEERGYEDLITKDLVQHVEGKYRVHGREQRALMGVSMGGYGALKMAFKQPQLFGTVAAHSAALLPRDPDTLEEVFPWLKRWGGAQRLLSGLFGNPVDAERWAAENLLILSENLEGGDLTDLSIYMDCGDQDRYGFATPNTELHEILTGKGIDHTWRLVEGGNHGWRANYNQQALPHSLEFVAAVWAARKGTSSQPSDGRPAPAPDENGTPGR